jgi:hypothetical protein
MAAFSRSSKIDATMPLNTPKAYPKINLYLTALYLILPQSIATLYDEKMMTYITYLIRRFPSALREIITWLGAVYTIDYKMVRERGVEPLRLPTGS